jgi:hypothetical protein
LSAYFQQVTPNSHGKPCENGEEQKMNRQTTITATLLICILLPTSTQAKSDDTTEVPTISVTKLDINDKTLKLIYEIRNDLNQDVWICDSVSQHHDFEVYLDEDGRTLLVRKRLDVTSSAFYSVQPWGKYSHLCPGERRIESLWLALPARPIYLYKSRTELRSLVNATRVSIEIGYYLKLTDLRPRGVFPGGE